MKVILFSRYGTLGASSRLRSFQYLPFLKTGGIEVAPQPLFDNAYLASFYAEGRKNIASIISAYFKRTLGIIQLSRFDLIWIEKELLPWIPPWVESYLFCQKLPVLVDYDDAIFHLYDKNKNYLLRRVLGRKIDRIMQKARLVTVGNQYLAQRAHRAGAGWVEILPTVIDLTRYQVTPIKPNSTFTIGWVGSPTTAAYLKLVEGALSEFCRQKRARLVVVGAGNLSLRADITTEFRPWSEDNESAFIQDFDVGIMPLPDTPWTRGKCGYKLIQYMGCGRPVIASEVSAALGIVQNGTTGFLARSKTQWIDQLETLYNDRQLAADMGRKGRKIVADRYCLQVTGPRLKSFLIHAAV